MITRYGLDVVVVVVVMTIAIIVLSGLFIKISYVKYPLILLSGFFLLFTLYFFRDPERITPKNENFVIAPADGRIIFIKEIQEDIYFKEPAVQVSIFMSPLNVHVNRYPVTGVIEYFKHIPGKFLVAFEDKASDVNERTLIGIKKGNDKILMKQIAGFVARRIVADLSVGMNTKSGERFGMIKFGSRVDVIMPKKFSINVKIDDVVKAGETVLAEINNQ